MQGSVTEFLKPRLVGIEKSTQLVPKLLWNHLSAVSGIPWATRCVVFYFRLCQVVQ